MWRLLSYFGLLAFCFFQQGSEGKGCQNDQAYTCVCTGKLRKEFRCEDSFYGLSALSVAREMNAKHSGCFCSSEDCAVIRRF